jgi:hypothetical protein
MSIHGTADCWGEGDARPPYRLAEEIIALSVANTWAEAKREWALVEVYFADEPRRCLCSHYPIIECCVIRNRLNGNEVIVGNCCVKRFRGLPSAKVFEALKRVIKDRGAALNQAAVEYAHDRGWLSDGERDFYLNTIRPSYRLKGLSPKQLATRVKINERVLARLRASRGGRSHD